MRSHVLVALFTLSGLLAAQETLPRPEAPFGGRIGLRPSESAKDFPKESKPPEGAPNVLLIMTDDVGFGASSTFGGPIPTPTFDRLAEGGLRYNQFHTTALCSPTRAALLTGRNHHTCATGVIMEAGVGYPGYNTLMPKSCGTVAETLRQHGYNTAWFGKNHNVPDWHSSQAGPFDLWPTGLGFEHFYGFVGGDTNQWAPALVEGTKPIEPPHDDPNYNFDVDLADRAIAYIRQQHALAPSKPFFVYYCPGTAHAPHHAPKEWIARFKGQFDQGWDKVREETLARQKKLGVAPGSTVLTPRPEGIPAWDSLSADQKRVYAHMMEVYCAALAHCDHQIGRILEAVEGTGELDNTLVIYIQGDNGASAEGGPNGLLNEMTFFNAIPEDFAEVVRRMDELGGPTAFNHYPCGWAHAMDSPMQWTKQVASHYGGTRNGLVLSWPKRIRGAGPRPQWHHVIDIAPTILEAVGVEQPSSINGITQKPIEGVSMLYSFDAAQEPSRRKTQYFEMLGNRGIYSDGWVACTTPTDPPWASVARKIDVIDGYEWELYHVAEDFSQARNVAAEHPEKLRSLQLLFYAEAARYNVLPIDNSKVERLDVNNRPSLTRGRTSFEYRAGMVRIPEGAAPDVKNRSFSVTAEVEVKGPGEEGVLVTQGGRFAGWGFYLKEGVPVFTYNLADVALYRIAAEKPIAAGKHTLTAEFRYDGGKELGKGGTLTILVDGAKAGEGEIERTLPFRMSLDETLDVGHDTGTALCDDYKLPFRFTGDLLKLTIDLK